MPYIPEEIVDKIMSCATAGDRIFYNHASFVSHTFHQIVLPYKFKSLIFRENLNFFPVIPIQKFCEAINDGDPHALSLAPLVQELSLIKLDFYRSPLYKFEKTINSVLSFRNLTKLNMQECLTSLTVMEQLGKLVQLQSLHTWRCDVTCSCTEYVDTKRSHGALSNLQSLHTLECQDDGFCFSLYLAHHIPMKNLRILKSSDPAVIEALLTTDPAVQLEELWLTQPGPYILNGDYSLLWNYLTRVTSLTHLSLPGLLKLRELEGPPPPASLIFPFQDLQYLRIHVAFAPLFANQPLKELKIDTKSRRGEVMEEVREHWKGIVFPHVEYLLTDRRYEEMGEIPIEFWREFLLNVNKVGAEYPC